MAIRINAPAKINLSLHVIGKRADGYHLLESLVAFAEFGDRLAIEPAGTLSLHITGPFGKALQQENNLILKAAQLLQAHTGCKAGARIVLEKHIPVGAGLGGGSADAAAALSALKKLWNITVDDAALQKIALQLGADVPVCLAGHMAWMRGIGEQVTPVKYQGKMPVLLVNPGVLLPTADVFKKFSAAFAAPSAIPETIRSDDALLQLINDKSNMLEDAATALQPAIADVLKALRTTKCALARMSGSGATCFALYNSVKDSEEAAAEIRRRHPAWWVTATRLAA